MKRIDLIKAMVEEPGRTATGYANQLGANPTECQLILAGMKKQGLIRRELQDNGKPHNSYHNQYIWYLAVGVI